MCLVGSVQVMTAKKRYEVGLSKLATTESSVAGMQVSWFTPYEFRHANDHISFVILENHQLHHSCRMLTSVIACCTGVSLHRSNGAACVEAHVAAGQPAVCLSCRRS